MDGESKRSKAAITPLELSDEDGWRAAARDGCLGAIGAEAVFAACRAMAGTGDQQLVGAMMQWLAARAARYLRKRTSRHYPNGGEDAIDAVVHKLLQAILTPSSCDAEGYAVAFEAKLRQRLTDELRRETKALARRAEPRAEQSDDVGEPIEVEFADPRALTPEEAMQLHEILDGLDPRKRKAFILNQFGGYPAFSDQPGKESVASMLDISRKTAETWLRETKALVTKRIRG